jgi:dihydroxy-acid dehydratase
MEDFFYAGGLPALLREVTPQLNLDCRTVSGKTLGENIAGAKTYNSDVIRTIQNPVMSSMGLAILRGNLAPDGAVIKVSATTQPELLQHSGRVIVFDSYNEMNARIDRPDLDVDAKSVLVLRNAGPKGGPGMPEWGQLPIPRKLLQQGVRDMVRISDARMSGTSYGTCVLHISPESFVGGPLALLEEGDVVELDVAGRQLNMRVSDEELSRRRALWKPAAGCYPRGYGRLFLEHIRQANDGCDFDFLEGTEPISEPEIH